MYVLTLITLVYIFCYHRISHCFHQLTDVIKIHFIIFDCVGVYYMDYSDTNQYVTNYSLVEPLYEDYPPDLHHLTLLDFCWCTMSNRR